MAEQLRDIMPNEVVFIRGDSPGLNKDRDGNVWLQFIQDFDPGTATVNVQITPKLYSILLLLIALGFKIDKDPSILPDDDSAPFTTPSAIEPDHIRIFPPSDYSMIPLDDVVMAFSFGNASFAVYAPREKWRTIFEEISRLEGFTAGPPKNFQMVVKDGTIWAVTGEHEEKVLETLETDSDRAVAIIAGSMVEIRIENAIRSRCKRDKKIEDFMFQAAGPLGSFRAKIDLAYMLGLVTKEAHQDLVILKDVRNLFAHRLDITDFDSQRVRDKVQNLTLIETHVSQFTEGSQHLSLDPKERPRIRILRYDERKKAARDRYLVTAQLFIIAAMEASVRPGASIPFL